MADGNLVDRLDETIETILARRNATAALGDQELAPLARIAVDLRHVPSAAFKERLKANLEGKATMSRAVTTIALREGFTTVTPYLRVPERGIVDFLKQVFDAEETSSAAGGWGGLHRELRIGNSMLMIGEGGPVGVSPIRPAAFHVYVSDADATFARALAAGLESLGAPEDRPYGERAGFLKDRFGNHWYVATAFGASHVPDGRRTVTPLLHVRGGAAFIDFLTRAFGAVEELRHEAPPGTIRHACVRIGDSAVEMGESESEPMPCAFYLYVGDADVLFERAVAAGAKPIAPPADQSYGERVGTVEDPNGNTWFIAQPRLLKS
jgi:PhnB protein